MKVLIDGKEIPFKDDVKIIYDLENDDDTVEKTELHLNFTEEGVIGDVWFDIDNSENPVTTCSHEVEDLIDCLGLE